MQHKPFKPSREATLLPPDLGWAAGYPQSLLTKSGTAAEKGLTNDPATGTAYANLSKLSDFLGRLDDKLPGITITSAYRSPAVNAAVGGAKESAHMAGLAVDFHVPHMTNTEIGTWLYRNIKLYPEVSQVIVYTDTDHIHVGIKPGKKVSDAEFLIGSKSSGSYRPWSPMRSLLQSIALLSTVGVVLGGTGWYLLRR